MRGSNSLSLFVHISKATGFVLLLALGNSAFANSTEELTTPSCIGGGASPAKIKLGSSGIDEETIRIVEGDSGPELQIGGTRIFMDPTISDDPTTDPKSVNNRWCYVDARIAKEQNPLDPRPKEAKCDLPSLPSKTDKDGVPITIRGTDGSVIGQLFAVVHSIGGKESSRLVFAPSGSGASDRPKNRLSIIGHVTKKGEQVTSRLLVESRNVDGDKVNGALEASMSGKIATDSDSDPTPTANKKFAAGCISNNQARGQLRKKEDKVPQGWVDLSGSHIVMRGHERYGIDQFKTSSVPEYMTDDAGRSGGGFAGRD